MQAIKHKTEEVVKLNIEIAQVQMSCFSCCVILACAPAYISCRLSRKLTYDKKHKAANCFHTGSVVLKKDFKRKNTMEES